MSYIGSKPSDKVLTANDITDGVVSIKAKNKLGSTASYSFYVPQDADPNKMSANLEDGLLTITFEKEEDVKPKKIKIK